MAAAKRHLHTSGIAGDEAEDGWARSPYRDLAGRTLHLRSSDIMVLGGYARDGEYHPLATSVAQITRNGKVPFVWLADFNAPPDELKDPDWLDRLDACVIRPDSQITCHVGSGSLIDFAVVSSIYRKGHCRTKSKTLLCITQLLFELFDPRIWRGAEREEQYTSVVVFNKCCLLDEWKSKKTAFNRKGIEYDTIV